MDHNMYHKMKQAAAALIIMASLAACTAGPRTKPSELIVSVAASMVPALAEVKAAYEQSHPGVVVRLNGGSSGGLQQQIAKGAPVDLFISAGQEPIAALVQSGLVEPGDVRTVASNTVVLVRPATGAPQVNAWEDLKSDTVRRIAIGNPAHVPAGQYAQAVMESLNLWSGVQARLVLGEDVRQVLNYVEAGEVAAGVVYATDAATAPKVAVVASAPPGSHKPVVYPMAVLKAAPHRPQAQEFAAFLLSPAGRAVLKKHGFGEGDK